MSKSKWPKSQKVETLSYSVFWNSASVIRIQLDSLVWFITVDSTLEPFAYYVVNNVYFPISSKFFYSLDSSVMERWVVHISSKMGLGYGLKDLTRAKIS